MLPLCGELNTTGPRHSAGSRISKGGSSSSFTSDMAKGNFHLTGRKPRPHAFGTHYGRKPAIVHGAKPTARSRLALDSPCPAIRGRFNSLFTRHPPLWGGEK